MRLTLAALLVAGALPAAAQTALPQIEPETEFPVWGAPETRRAFFESERERMQEEAARLEAERAALAAERAEAEAEAEKQAPRLFAAPRRETRWRTDRVLVCPDRPRPHPDRPRHEVTAEEKIGATRLLRSAKGRDHDGYGCYWQHVKRPHRRDGLVLRIGPDGVSGRLRLTGPNGHIVIEGR